MSGLGDGDPASEEGKSDLRASTLPGATPFVGTVPLGTTSHEPGQTDETGEDGGAERRTPELFSRSSTTDSSWFERSWWTAAGIIVLLWSFQLLGWVSAYQWLTLAVVGLGGWGLATVLTSWRAGRTASHRALSRVVPVWMAWITLAVVVGAFVVWSLLQVYDTPSYGTDEIAFDQYAASLVVHGSDPYVHSMAPAFQLFHVQPNGYTFRLDGSPVTALSYPALSFLLYTPFLAAGVSTQLAVAINVFAWALTILLLFVLLPRPMRPMAIVIGSLSVYISFAVGGITSALFIPLLVGAVVAWNRFPFERGWRAWRGPALLGLAMAVKQTPWFVLPFLVLGVALEASARSGWPFGARVAARYLGIALLAFLAPNLPFVVWHPGAWWHGILTPLTSQLVPAGQGSVALSLYLHAGGGSLTALAVLSLVVLVVLLCVFGATYPALRGLAVVLPAVALFFATRSYSSYLVELIPAGLVAAVTVQPTAWPKPWHRWPWVAGVGGGSALIAFLIAMLISSPLTIGISDVHTTGQLATVDRIVVNVHNRSSSSVRPHFTVNSGDVVTSFWLTQGGPPVLSPGEHATYTLLAPNFFAQPPVTGGFQVAAFTTNPAAVSHSLSYRPTTSHLALVPDAVSRVVPIGQAIVFRAEILDKLDRPVRKAGIPVYMGQIIYAQQGLQYGEAIINSGQPGQTPVSATTDADGVATFIVRGTRATADPVYFEANLVNDQHFYPYGYSQIVPVRFGAG